MSRNGSNRLEGIIQDQSLEQRLDALFGRMVSYEQQLIEVRRDVSPDMVRKLIDEGYANEKKDLMDRNSVVVALLGYLYECYEQGEPVTREGVSATMRKLRGLE